MDDRAKNTINCGLDVNDYNLVSTCETAQEMCRMLEFTQKDTNQVKETKKNTLVLQYDAFKMKEHESINEIYSRFALIINGLQLLGKVYPKNKMDDHSNEVSSFVKKFDYDKLKIAFLELSENHEKLKLKNVALKKKVLSLINNVEELASEKEELD
ncbi:hypothetical protein RJ640_026590 [Escallonia rubra]|uniref:Uncharacterized protein n=1 Tax=Escallonia rubra TaxID=112253 RepID=A0AA88U0Z0_9ASTE|nr:hypothetical protein RJ640_026590 [Escallonia rubra]